MACGHLDTETIVEVEDVWHPENVRQIVALEVLDVVLESKLPAVGVIGYVKVGDVSRRSDLLDFTARKLRGECDRDSLTSFAPLIIGISAGIARTLYSLLGNILEGAANGADRETSQSRNYWKIHGVC